MDYSNSLDEEAFCDFVSEIQLRFNQPWTHVRMISHGEEVKIIERWEDGGFND